MRLLITLLLLVFLISCSKEPVKDSGSDPVGTDTTKHDTIPVAAHVLVLGLTNDSLVVWVDDTMHFLHNHYNMQSRSEGGQMIYKDSTLYIAGGNEDNKAVYYKNFEKHILWPYYSHAATIDVDNGNVYVAGFTMDLGDGKNQATTYATYWEDGIRSSYFSDASQFKFVKRVDTVTTLLGFELYDVYPYGAGIYMKNNVRYGLASLNAVFNAMAVKDTVTYIVGNIILNGWQPIATQWKNGKERLIDGQGRESQATAICLYGKDVYISGRLGKKAVYWKNGVLVPLSENASARDIKVIGNDVYVVGQYLDPKSGNLVAVLWKNGSIKILSPSFQMSDAFSIVVL